MNKYIFFFIIIGSFYINACNKDDRTSTLRENTTSTPDTKNDSSGIQAALDNMMRSLHAQKITGNPDYDFAMLMIPHHQGAVDISSTYLGTAKDPQIKSIAEQIIGKNKSEINELKSWSTVYKDTIETVEGDKYKGIINDNMTEMMKHMELIRSSDPDVDFVVVMVPHHRDAIEMAKVEIDFGKDEKLKSMAKNMIKDLQEQIRVMEEWRAKRE
ncbi:MAG: DUF305 domain-containing protein [Ignavibacteriae bacterium]|nr:MAG: DUF305 domain-containing protein [Ignavibacteriota bacterium]